jgi:predicted transcriptional regulator
MTAPRGVKLDEMTQHRLEALAQIKDRSPHWLMCMAIKTYLDHEERYEQEKREDMERWQRYQLTGEAIPQATAAAWLGELAQGKVLPCPK